MIEVLKQALDALETEVSIDWTNNDEFNASAEKMHDAITSLQQAIAKLESQDGACQHCAEKGCVACDARKQEPVGEVSDHDWSTGLLYRDLEPGTPLYAHPPQRTWVGLASEDRLTAKYMQDAPDGIEAVIDYIEAKLKEKNT
jgi:hypothetical protein